MSTSSTEGSEIPLTVGDRLIVYSPDHDQWYNGTVERCSKEDKSRVYIRYRAEDAEWTDTTTSQWRKSKEPDTWVLPPDVEEAKRKKREIIEKLKVGSRVDVWWPLEKQHYTGTLTMSLPLSKEETDNNQQHYIKYDDGDAQWTNLLHCKFQKLESKADQLVIGSRISVHHKLEGGKFTGTVTKIRPDRARPHQVSYDDKSKGKEWLNLHALTFKNLESEDVNSTSTVSKERSEQSDKKKRKLEQSCDKSSDYDKETIKAKKAKIKRTKKQPNSPVTCQEICGICVSPVERPRAIPCHHIFCKRCIKSHCNINKNSSKTSCPVCETTIRKDWVKYNPKHASFHAVEALDRVTGKIVLSFSTASAASLESPGMVPSRIVRACLEGERREHRGYFWRFRGSKDRPSTSLSDEDYVYNGERREKYRGKKKDLCSGDKIRQNQRRVEQLCAETGRVLRTFDSIRVAADSMGLVSTGGISKCCNGASGARTSGGFRWRFT